MTENIQPFRTWRMVQALLLRLVRGCILALASVIAAGVAVGTLWIPFNADPGPDPRPWCILFGTIGFVTGCKMRSSRFGPQSSSVVAFTLAGTVIGLFGLYFCGAIAAERAVTLASFPAQEQPLSHSKFHPGIAFTKVAVPWGFFAGTGVGLLVGLGRVASKRTGNCLFAAAAVLAVIAASAVWFQFDAITREYVKVFEGGIRQFFHPVPR